uniref:hypothetical protein n=1 Tax=Olsenella uli TaxID=133926 RepID=UPI0028ECA6B3|nr:hypothetical protein [Olsenella uli]
MAGVDWSRGDLDHSLRVLMVDPHDLATRRGELSGVVRAGSLVLDVDSDTKAKASVKVVSGARRGGWDGSSALRLVHDVGDVTGPLLSETLFTGIVTSLSWSSAGDLYETSIELGSMLKALDVEVFSDMYVMPPGSHAVATWRQLCEQAGRACRVDAAIPERTYDYTLSFDAGWSLRKVLAYLARDAGATQDVDPDGTVALLPYTSPSARAHTYAVDETSPRGTMVGHPSGSDDTPSMPGRYVVHAESGDDHVVGEAYAPAGSATSRGVRGYLLDAYRSETSLSPFTAAHAAEVARSRLAVALSEAASISHKLMYRPLTLRDVERLRGSDGRLSRWYVRSARLDLGSWTWDLDLRGGWTA